MLKGRNLSVRLNWFETNGACYIKIFIDSNDAGKFTMPSISRRLPTKFKCLINARISVANLANNHILDYGDEGLVETFNTFAPQTLLTLVVVKIWRQPSRR